MKYAVYFLAVTVVSSVCAACGLSSSSKSQSTVTLAELHAPAAAPTYYLGSTFEGLPLTSISDSKDEPDFIYGDCTPPSGLFSDSGCSPPLEVQHWALSKRPPSKFAGDIGCRRVGIPGRTAAIFESTGGIEVYAGKSTVVIFADSTARMKRAAAALRPVKGGTLPAPPAWVDRQLTQRCGAGTTTNRLIVLDHSIGGVALKETRSAAELTVGRGVVLQTTVDRSARPTPARITRVSYQGGSLIVTYVSGAGHPPRAFLLETRSARYRTRSGVGVGSTSAAMVSLGGVKCYGGTECQHGYAMVNKPGTTFRLDRRGGKIVAVAMTFGH